MSYSALALEATQVINYAEFGQRICKGASLLANLGLKPGSGLALLSENNPDFLTVYWAAQVSGLFFTPISTQYQSSEIEYLLNDCDASILIVSAIQFEKIAHLDLPQQHIFTLEQWLSALLYIEPDSSIRHEHYCEGADMLYSSGSTGSPKGIRNTQPGAPLGTVSQITHRRLELHDISQTTVYLSTAPLYHSAPLRYNQMVLRSGGTSIIMDKFDAPRSLALIEKYAITHSQWVPTMFIRLLKLPRHIRQAHTLTSHRFAIHAAAPCPKEVKQQMLDWWGPIIYEYYGGTEGNGQTSISPAEWMAHPGSVGRLLTGIIHIQPMQEEETPDTARPEFADLPSGQSGLVYFEGGPEFAYYKNPLKTQASRTVSGWSTLGDIGYLDADGYLYLTDRKSFMIISGGVNIYPVEVENTLLSHPAVTDTAVFGIPNAEFGEEVKAAVQLNDKMLQSTSGQALIDLEAELIAYCKTKIAHLKCPRSIDFHLELPRHQTGKIYKHGLREKYLKT
ncbi:MAG: AMP-binding protein [Pseudomonadales bacterium]|nr:AMP-binding protein [Pseudomonadales bacterium]